MQIIPNDILKLLLIKHTNFKTFDIPLKENMSLRENLNLELATQNNKSILTIAANNKPLLKIPLEEVLKELNIKVTDENLMILEKLITKKSSLTPKKFQIISQHLNKYPLVKEELLEFLFNPFFHLILFNEQNKTKTSFYLNERKKNKEIELTILFNHPKTDDILIKIYWSQQPIINMYFTKEKIKDYFSSKIYELKEQLSEKFVINCFYQPQINFKKSNVNYYKVDLKI